MNDVIVRKIDMPVGIRGATIKDSDGDYNVYLNARLSPNIQDTAYRHEMEHIQNGDFEKDEPVRDKEDRIPF